VIRSWWTCLADRLDVKIHVSHLPPGTSRWNKVEHRLFSFVSINWRGRPLPTYETVINLISNAINRGGLVVRARLGEVATVDEQRPRRSPDQFGSGPLAEVTEVVSDRSASQMPAASAPTARLELVATSGVTGGST
jgi:Rhodopirellula transposase DDE domain